MGHGFALAVGALAFSALAGDPAAAVADVHITSVGIYDYATTRVTGTPSANAIGAGIIRMIGTDSTGSVDFDAFCVDLAHHMFAGRNVQKAVSYNFNFATLADDGFGNPLSFLQVKQMKGLASLGFTLVGNPLKVNDIDAIQVAIWTIEYPHATFKTTNPAVNALVPTYLALAPTLTGTARYLKSVDRTERQGVLIPGVPEPATWAMLIAGFGLVGAILRRRRLAAV